MSDEKQPEGQESEGGATGQAPDNRQVQQKPAETVEELRALLEKERKDRQEANREAQNIRTRLRELEKADEERKREAMTEQERIAAELEATRKSLADTQEQHKQMILRNAVMVAAQKFGIQDSDAAIKLLDHSKLQFDDAGHPTNVDDLVSNLVKEKPYLVLAQGTGFTNASRAEGAGIGREQELRQILYGNDGNVFDPNRIKAAGGGVVRSG